LARTQFAGAVKAVAVGPDLMVATSSVPAWLAAGRVGVTVGVVTALLAPICRFEIPAVTAFAFR
jgi:hypothetical protein